MSRVAGKTVVITGASAGTGAAAARALHRLGANVVPVGRSAEKTAAVARELGVRGYTVDFANLEDVQRLARTLLDALPRIDVLAANAGSVVPGGRGAADGLEPTLAVNALGPWLLLRLLGPRLRGGRVVSTSSRSHVGAGLEPSRIQDTAGMRPHDVYARAKLAFGLLLREFGRRHPDVVVADFHPGIIASDFGRYLGVAGGVLTVLARPFLDTPEDGARRLVQLVTTDEEISGRYFSRGHPAAGSPLLQDRTLSAALWSLAERLCAGYLWVDEPGDVTEGDRHAVPTHV